MKKVKLGVLGLGWFGQKHAQVLSQLPHVELVSVCSRTPERAQQIAQECRARRWDTTWKALLEDPEIEAVSIVTHINEHHDAVMQALAAGKHVLVEKPIAATVAEADAMIEAAEKSRLIFMVGHILRFENRYAQAKSVIEAGRLGKILSIYARRNIPGHFARPHLNVVSSLVGDAIHDTDLMLWYTGDSVQSVYATWNFVASAPHADVGWCIYNFNGGAKGVCESVWALAANASYAIDAKMEIIGSDGALYIDCAEGGLAIQDRHGWKWPDTMHWPSQHGRIVGALQEELKYFVDCVATAQQPLVARPQEAREALKVVLAAEKSAREKAIVHVG